MNRLVPVILGICVGLSAAKPPAETPTSPQRVRIASPKGTYILYWDVVYVTNISNSWSTLIEPPPGFLLIDVIIGDAKSFRTERNENRAVVKRVAPDNVTTNMQLVLAGPDRIPRTLTFELTGNNDSRVSNIQFVMPNDRESNSLVEAAKALYSKQLDEALSAKEIEMKSEIQDATVKALQTFRFGSYVNCTKEKEYGVTVFLNSIVNSDNKGYVYLSTNANDPECQVVQLLGIKGSNSMKPVRQISAVADRGTTEYVYETTPFVKDGKKNKYKFLIKIYGDTSTIKAKVQ